MGTMYREREAEGADKALFLWLEKKSPSYAIRLSLNGAVDKGWGIWIVKPAQNLKVFYVRKSIF